MPSAHRTPARREASALRTTTVKSAPADPAAAILGHRGGGRSGRVGLGEGAQPRGGPDSGGEYHPGSHELTTIRHSEF